MKTIIPLLVLLFSTAINGFAQKTVFGILNPSDVEMKECAFEKDAPAVVLFDKGNSWFVHGDDGFILRFDRHIRIKVFSEAGFEQGEIEIPLFHNENNREKVKDIKAMTFNFEEGQLKRATLDSKNVFTEDINENWTLKKFAMPNVKEGSVIDVTYSVYSPFFTHFKDWEFQTDIPTLYSEYKVSMIPFYSYRYRMQGASRMDHFKSYEKSGLGRTFSGIPYNDMVYEFGLRNVPSFKDESFISSRNDYIKKIDFQLSEINYPSGYKKQFMNTWPSLAEELLDYTDFGKYLKKAEKWGSKTLASLSSKPEEERLDTVLNYMKETYKWNGYYGKYARSSFKEFNEQLTGNSGNINLSTIGALRAVGLKASPVIISTRDNGKVSDNFPYSNLFNYVLVLVEVDGKKRLVDATEDMCPNFLIPSRCINGKGFIVEEDSEAWVTISNSAASLEEFNLSMELDLEAGELEGRCMAKSTGYMALAERQEYHNDKEDFEKEFENKGINIVDDISVTNLTDKTLPFKYNFDFTKSYDQIDEQLIISPFVNIAQTENPFKQEKRTLPIDLVYLQGNRFIATIKIPEGYKVEELPSPRKINSDNVAFSYIAKVTGKQIQIVANYSFKKRNYPSSSYKELKNFMNTVTSTVNSKIILVKEDDVAVL
ncbi:DUF3857 domain-containing protein [Carboxylicivirga sp. A043]|uniref:DUF3857 domain-containing protein n=1 Tax=Carboxylicivirga litoralis TaxID=2816963 RepID=UPI0021CB0698|nr:DUF3857 domain-containing protein [Carboxylicivirga sp. A043]MCU4156296.1 DUF3857 domain-containing protein [Carboxylicivirga sp. A043]